MWGELRDHCADGVPQSLDGSFRGLAQQRLQFGEGLFDGIEVGTVGRQVEQRGTDCFDSAAHARQLVAAKIVHDDDVAGLQNWREDLVHIGLKRLAIDRTIKDERRDHAAQPQTRNKCRGFPMSMGDAGPQALAFGSAAACAGHIGRAPGFVDEDEAGRIEIELAFKPCLAPLQDIGTAVFAGVRSLF